MTAVSTERLYGQLDATDDELSDIRAKASKLKADIGALIRAFAEDYSCSSKSTDYALEYTEDALVDLIDDAEGPTYRRKVRLEDQIGDIEDADLRRSAPMVL